MDPPLRPTTGTAPPSLPLVSDEAAAVALATGQRLRAVVAALPGDGRVILGAFGIRFEARTQAPLEVGRTYDFEVLATAPALQLAARGGAVAAMPAATMGGWLPGGALSSSLLASMAALGARSPSENVDGAAAAAGSSGRPDVPVVGADVRAGDLAAVREFLGHDLEARVLRLAARQAGTPADQGARIEAALLRGSLKAQALEVLAATSGADGPRPSAERVAAAEQVVRALGAVERDNALRADYELPQWWPLTTTGDLREARVFERPAEDGGRPDAGRGFTAVLLLDFTELGPVRVDLTVEGSRVRAAFCVVDERASCRLVPTMAELREALEASGLEVGELTVRRAPGQALPVADLRLPTLPGTQGGVDVRA